MLTERFTFLYRERDIEIHFDRERHMLTERFTFLHRERDIEIRFVDHRNTCCGPVAWLSMHSCIITYTVGEGHPSSSVHAQPMPIAMHCQHRVPQQPVCYVWVSCNTHHIEVGHPGCSWDGSLPLIDLTLVGRLQASTVVGDTAHAFRTYEACSNRYRPRGSPPVDVHVYLVTQTLSHT
jgi:hypothetical protein